MAINNTLFTITFMSYVHQVVTGKLSNSYR